MRLKFNCWSKITLPKLYHRLTLRPLQWDVYDVCNYFSGVFGSWKWRIAYSDVLSHCFATLYLLEQHKVPTKCMTNMSEWMNEYLTLPYERIPHPPDSVILQLVLLDWCHLRSDQIPEVPHFPVPTDHVSHRTDIIRGEKIPKSPIGSTIWEKNGNHQTTTTKIRTQTMDETTMALSLGMLCPCLRIQYLFRRKGDDSSSMRRVGGLDSD